VSDQFHAQAVLPMGKDLHSILTRKLSVPHSWSGHFREEKNLLPLPETEPQFLGCTAFMWPSHYTAYANPAPSLYKIFTN